ncbi:hypothetical protein [Pandoraea fibrosis]|uniref:Uncharacterized protein n=1 Tax=Pandoraea fibrosis TaxID=1891094 RepID=A0A5E4RGC3_9BURK|nr:hypothetical protein [Pandoraea fibrosis]QHE92926.1 hypothetical protein PJ20_014640 [Pandoraea fibrosis]QHF13517.1 hypothetical protein PI93_013360 [Pandoraea fibrosis]VVD61572.1 hypothetical protein PFI31113_00133 [Pandoraea fibrosis]
MTQSDKPSVTPSTQSSPADTPLTEAERVHLDDLLAHHSVTETVDRASVIDLIKELRSPEVKTAEDRERVVKESRLWREVSHRDTAMSLLNSLAQMAPIFLNQIHW